MITALCSSAHPSPTVRKRLISAPGRLAIAGEQAHVDAGIVGGDVRGRDAVFKPRAQIIEKGCSSGQSIACERHSLDEVGDPERPQDARPSERSDDGTD